MLRPSVICCGVADTRAVVRLTAREHRNNLSSRPQRPQFFPTRIFCESGGRGVEGPDVRRVTQLIERNGPTWEDLAADWGRPFKLIKRNPANTPDNRSLHAG